MNKEQNISKIIENGDTLIFEYKYKINENVIKGKKMELQVGANSWFNGFDDLILGKEYDQNNILELKGITLTSDFDENEGQVATISLKIKSHTKSKTSSKENILDLQIKKLTERNEILSKKLDDYEYEKNQQLIDFKNKTEEMSQKAQSEIIRIREEIKQKAKEELQEQKQFLTQKLIEDLLIPLNHLFLSVEFGSKVDNPIVKNYASGFTMLTNQIKDVLLSHGVSEIAPEVGEEYNPEFHHAIEIKEDKEFKTNQIIEVKSKGYKLNSRVLKPATTVVAK